jgi:transmembrane sensor
MDPVMTIDQRHVPHETLRRQAKDWVVHIATGEVTDADLRALERWRGESPMHAEAYQQACQLWGVLETPLRAASRRSSRSIGRRAFLGGGLAAAAAVTGVMIARPPLALWPSFGELAADYRTGAGEQRRIDLADRGAIEMNTRTSLNLREGAGAIDSIEMIGGEAAIKTGQRSLVVKAGAGRVAAVNAEFTVRCEGAHVRVACLNGSVDIDVQGQVTAVRPREQVSYQQDLGQVAAAAPDVVAGWRDGLLIFDNEPLARVIEEVNRYRTGRIVLMNTALGERRVSARFKLARLDAVLTQFQETFGAKVTPLAGGFVLLT